MDVEKTMEFILAREARMAVRMDGHDQRIGELEIESAKLTKEVEVIAGAINALISTRQEERDVTNGLGHAMDGLRKEVLRTTENMNALIRVVELKRPRT